MGSSLIVNIYIYITGLIALYPIFLGKGLSPILKKVILGLKPHSTIPYYQARALYFIFQFQWFRICKMHSNPII